MVMVSKFFIFMIKIYQRCISPFFPPSCRFYPTCSEYAIQAISYHGLLKGLFLSIRRICRCHPFTPGGFDPVPLPEEMRGETGK